MRPRHLSFFFLNDPATPEIYPLPLHDALPISFQRDSAVSDQQPCAFADCHDWRFIFLEKLKRQSWQSAKAHGCRSEKHTPELQSQSNSVCRLLLEKKKKTNLVQWTQPTTESSH